MKIFLSVPMSGRTDEQIRSDLAEMKAEFLLNNPFDKGEEIVFVHNFQEMEVVTNTFDPFEGERKTPALYYLGRAINKMAYCDAVLFAENYALARGCMAELYIAKRYDIPCYFIMTGNLGEPIVCKAEGSSVIGLGDRLEYDNIEFDSYRLTGRGWTKC